MNKVEIICDGGCRNNQDPLKREAYGSFIIKTTPNLVPSPPVIHKRFYGNKTNNEAEYLALIDALQFVKEKYHNIVNFLIVKTDSQLLVGHFSLGWKIKEKRLFELYSKAKYLIADTVTHPISGVTFEKITGDEMKQTIGH